MAGLLSDFYIRVFTWVKGERVGEDRAGNTYYRCRSRGRGERRWVLYRQKDDASLVPPGWHGWLHGGMDKPIPDDSPFHRPWEKDHRPNMTGSAQAWYPPGHTLKGEQRPPATGDYEPWKPE
ncbi:MAG: NADH:ubiquinone oxidoreductase subunit NDUFA12 [Pseudomonadota bacterium]|nr:NADH:ubiquinone oxidoreductase subunit NDUFA12 [Pseudomonadota bacterium]